MIKRILIYLLIIVVVLFGVDHYLNQRKINDLLVQNKALDQSLKMSFEITPSRQIIYKTRTIKGEVKTVIKYLPPEGSAEVTQSSDGENTELHINARGFVFEPALVGLIAREPQIGAGARLVYWDRYGAGAGLGLSNEVSKLSPFIYADRRIDDFIPFLHNSALGIAATYQDNKVTAAAVFNAYL